jgi:ornithine decarboxylase
VEAARAVFDAAAARGMPPMRVLDIGGGFMAGTASTFQDACDVINSALTRHFGDVLPGLQVIGEPGRYFAETPFTLAARVFGKRTRGEVREYWIDDGLFGTLCCVHMENYVPRPVPVSGRAAAGGDANDDEGGETEAHPSTVFGPTLDSFDVVVKGYHLPELRIGDWLVFHDVGAYTTVLSCDFNGFSTSDMKTYLAFSSV